MSDEERLHKIFKGYLTQANIKEDIAEKIIQLAENYELKNKQKQFLARFQHVLKKCYDQKNHKLFVTTCRRFLFIINRLLERETKKDKVKKYTEIISEQIIQYYLFFFTIIFKHSFHDLSIDLKMYRMKWVKRITDNSFNKLRQIIQILNFLRQEILKKHKFNLDKGFSQENLLKIKTIHKKRGITQKQTNQYLGLQTKQEKIQKIKGYSQESPSDSQSSDSGQSYENNQKKIKLNNYNYELYQPYQSNQSNYPSYNANINYPTPPSNYYYEANKIQMPSVFDPRVKRLQPSSFPYPQSVPNTPTNYFPYPIQKIQIQQIRQPLKNFSQPNIGRPTQYNNNYEPYIDINQKLYPQNILPIYYRDKADIYNQQNLQKKKSNSLIQKLILIRQNLQKNSIKCRQCGQLFLTNNIYEKHATQHFFDSLSKVNQNDIKGKIKKQSKIKLFDIKSWEADLKPNEKQQSFQLLFSELQKLNLNVNKDKKTCLFCNQQFETVFSSACDEWVLSDAVKIQFNGNINIMHYQCYECFKSDENSPIDKIDI